jgi:hypothetical protein
MKTDDKNSGKTKSRPKAAPQCLPDNHDGTRNERKLDRASMAPLGDAVSQLGQIRADLERAGLMGAQHGLGPQFTPGSSEGNAYDGFASSEPLISGPTATDIAKKRKQRRDDQIQNLAEREAEATMKSPDFEYDPKTLLREAVALHQHPWMQEHRDIEKTERRQREGVGKPRPVDERATELTAELEWAMKVLTEQSRHRRETASKAATDAALEVAVALNLERPKDERLSDRELARRFDTNPMRVGRLRKEITGRV